MIYNENSLRETVRRMIVEYKVEKLLKDKKALVEEMAKNIAKIIVDENLDDSEHKVVGRMYEEIIPEVKKAFGLDRLEERLEEYIHKEVENKWYVKLENIKEGIEKNVLLTEDIKSNFLSRLERIIKVREKIIDELTKIAEKEGIDKLKENLDKLLPYAFRKVLPTPEDRRNYYKDLEKLGELYFEMLLESYTLLELGSHSESLKYYLESLGYKGKVYRRILDYYKTVCIDLFKKAYSPI